VGIRLERFATTTFTLPAVAMSVVVDAWLFITVQHGAVFVTRFEQTDHPGGLFVALVACAAFFPPIALLVPLGLRTNRRLRLRTGVMFGLTTLALHVALALASGAGLPIFASAITVEIATVTWARRRLRALQHAGAS
jgi:hypothetical protein